MLRRFGGLKEGQVNAQGEDVESLAVRYVDVFGAAPLMGNPVAVVHDADGLSDDDMATFARWTNLSETTFLLNPTDEDADYRLRIFTPGGELPFAGHPTLGSCHAWQEAGGKPTRSEVIVQECGVGRVEIRRVDGRYAFAAPPLKRSGPLDDALLARLVDALHLDAAAVVRHQWVDNGPGWCALLLDTAERVLALEPDYSALAGLALGAVAPQEAGADSDFEVRAFVPDMGVPEDPVTGSLNAGLGQWLISEGLAPERYVAAQGTAMKRRGRVFVEAQAREVWVAGATHTSVEGQLEWE